MIPEISVLMANFNGARYLGHAIKSLETQTFRNWELIFVDDCSRDESVALANRFAERDSRIQVVVQDHNRGPGAARNRAIELAKGHWMMVFDSDDIIRPQRLEILRERARSDRAPIVADNLLVFCDEAPQAKPFLHGDLAKVPHWIGLAEFIDSGQLYSRSADLGYLKPFISLDLLRKTGVRYDEKLRIGEDSDLIARLLAPGLKLRLEPSAHYMYRKHASSISHRIHRNAILALIEANARLVEELPLESADAIAALKRRDASLQSMLLYDQVITMLKAGDYRHAAAASLGAPQIWPLLTRPLTARLSKLAKRSRRSPLETAAIPQAVD
jgi:succinoglycan biosynthesis protein ExoO